MQNGTEYLGNRKIKIEFGRLEQRVMEGRFDGDNMTSPHISRQHTV